MNRKNLHFVCLALVCACVAPNPGVSRTVPTSGVELLTRMHDVYNGKWYKTLTFTQKSTTSASRIAAGSVDAETGTCS